MKGEIQVESGVMSGLAPALEPVLAPDVAAEAEHKAVGADPALAVTPEAAAAIE